MCASLFIEFEMFVSIQLCLFISLFINVAGFDSIKYVCVWEKEGSVRKPTFQCFLYQGLLTKTNTLFFFFKFCFMVLCTADPTAG